MKQAGIIGGMGPMATVEFFKRIVENTEASKDQEHINLLISNHATIPDRTDVLLHKEEKLESFLESIKKDFKLMNENQVEIIGIPCNTYHAFLDYYKNFTEIPIINMVEETVKSISKKAVLFGTKGTLELGIYQKAAENYGKELILPSKKSQEIAMNTIYQIKEDNNLQGNIFQKEISQWIEKDYEIIIACTELSLIEFQNPFKEHLLDAMDILTKELILRMGKKLSKNSSLNI